MTPEDLLVPDNKLQYNEAIKAAQESGESIERCDAELIDINEEWKEISEDMEGIEQTDDLLVSVEPSEASSSAVNTFMREGTADRPSEASSPAVNTFMREGTADKPIEASDNDLAILQPMDYRPTADLPPEVADRHREIVAVKNGPGGGSIGIIKYGPRNAQVFRREKVNGQDPENVPNISDPTTRPGEKFVYGAQTKRKIWVLNYTNLASVQGVAFPE